MLSKEVKGNVYCLWAGSALGCFRDAKTLLLHLLWYPPLPLGDSRLCHVGRDPLFWSCALHICYFSLLHQGKGLPELCPICLVTPFFLDLPDMERKGLACSSLLSGYTRFSMWLCLWASAELITKEISICLPITGDTIAVQKLDLYLWSLYLQVESSVFLLPSANASNVCLCSPLSFPRVGSAETDCKCATSPV